jgi:hypothetical protein
MRFCVSVPVLSVASTVMAPSASTADMRRVSTLCCEMRQAPSARNTVRITGISSGRMAMASAMPESTLASREWPSHSQPIRICAVASNSPATVSCTIRRREACCRPEGGSVVAASAWPMRPTAVAAPVAFTRASPTPLVITVLANRWGVPSPPGVAGAPAAVASVNGAGASGTASSGSGTGSLSTGTASPVSSDSSTVSWPCISRASAATRSPSCSTSRSPRTTSRPAMRAS